MPTFSAETLRDVARRIIEASGASPAAAAQVADSMADANLCGHDSHGIILISHYLDLIRKGDIVPTAEPEIARETATTLLVEGHWGFGQVVANFGMAHLMAKAKAHHVASCVLSHANHIGRLGAYVEQAAQEGLFCFMTCNSYPRGGFVAPYGGAERTFSTAPIAFAFPGGEQPPIVADFATSASAAAKLRLAANRGEVMPPGTLIDRDGHPSTNPQDFYDGGALLPFGGHKGYSLAFLGEALGGILSRHSAAPLDDYQHGNGVWALALDIAAFMPLADFTDATDQLVNRIQQVRPLAGFREVMVPGEPEARTRAQRQREGIPIEETTWNDIRRDAASVGVTL